MKRNPQPPATSQPIGEGSYEGARDYRKNITAYLQDADVAADARAAQPGNAAEAAELKAAEEEGRSHSRAKGK
jgi:hypothetical protein